MLKKYLPDCKESMETKHKRSDMLRKLLVNLRESLIQSDAISLDSKIIVVSHSVFGKVLTSKKKNKS